jgi:hypothetical protein
MSPFLIFPSRRLLQSEDRGHGAVAVVDIDNLSFGASAAPRGVDDRMFA